MRETLGPISIIIQLGARVVVATLLPLIIGIWLDNQLRTIPWITLIATVVGIVSAVASVYKVISAQYKRTG